METIYKHRLSLSEFFREADGANANVQYMEATTCKEGKLTHWSRYLMGEYEGDALIKGSIQRMRYVIYTDDLPVQDIVNGLRQEAYDRNEE